ncbi:hypothetical protein [Chitinolyticbacter albus]|uniref:hypothetical protein n=1 Tax=Chitinolyticbacter albus TaxID=2961951 RepID=UPI00210BE9AF|nr:hypothetical protein [Chitinolyticbacter albus]
MATNQTSTLVLVGTNRGITLIPEHTDLTRINYFDGRYLGAEDLTREQDYLRALVRESNRASGAGVVHGFNLSTLSGGRLQLSSGLAIDNEGRVLLLPDAAEVGIADLIARSQGQANAPATAGGDGHFGACEPAVSAPTATPVAGSTLYLIGIVHAEALCGRAEVWGKACESACAQSADFDARREGVVLLALPLNLATPLPTSSAVQFTAEHLRSRVASSYYADEQARYGKIMSAALLESSVWCRGALAASGNFVPLGVLAYSGGNVQFLDGWIARREHVDGHPKRYWQWQMMMRPWDVFLAQVLQFQCQLVHVLEHGPTPGDDDDPCNRMRRLVVEASDVMVELQRYYTETARSFTDQKMRFVGGHSQIADLVGKLQLAKQQVKLTATDRVLINGGIVELPSAGYLPVVAGSTLSVNQQVRALLGDGVDLRFCVVRPDYVAESWQEAQHMERISLTRGLDDPQHKDEVDILVPDGEIVGAQASKGIGWAVRVRGGNDNPEVVIIGDGPRYGVRQFETGLYRQTYEQDVLAGAGRSAQEGDGSLAFHFAGMMEMASKRKAIAEARDWAKANTNTMEQAAWYTLRAIARNQPIEETEADAVKGARNKSTAKKDAAADSTAGIAMNYARMRSEAELVRAAQSAKRAESGKKAGAIRYEGLADESVDHVALWVSAGAASDPFAAPEGSVVVVSLDITMLIPGDGAGQFLDVELTGRLTVEQRTVRNNGVSVRATFNGSATVSGNFAGTSGARRIIPLSVPVALTQTATSDGGRIGVHVDLAGANVGEELFELSSVRVTALWRDQPAAASLKIAFTTRGDDGAEDQSLLGASLVRDDNVLSPGNPLRVASETAIQVLATREGSPTFAADALADLFGAPPPSGELLTVLAKRDWVLFHRRRTRQCGIDAVVPRVDARRYQLFHLKVSSEKNLQTARAAVLSGDAARITKLGFAPVAVVEFEGGRSSIATPVTELLADWAAAQPGNRVRFGGIGSQGAAQAEGEVLAKARLASLELALTGAPDNAIDNVVLAVLPALGLSGLDGATFLITQQVKPACQDVYIIDGTANYEAFKRVYDAAGLAAALAQSQASGPTHAEFDSDGELTPASATAVVAAWNNPDTNPHFSLVFHAEEAERSAVIADANEVINELRGGDNPVEATHDPAAAQVAQCRSVAVLVRELVASGQVLLVRAVDYGAGHHFLNADSEKRVETWNGGTPQSASQLDNDLRQLMVNLKSEVATVYVHAQSQLPLAKQMADSELQAANVRIDPVRSWKLRSDVLPTAEYAELQNINEKPEDYQAVIFFSPIDFT